MDDAEIEERFVSVGPVAIRRMFGGKGIYRDGRIVAIIYRDELWLKTDERTADAFEKAGSRQWTYAREGRRAVAMPYQSVPDEALDDPDALERWIRLAVDVAERAPPPKPRSRSTTARRKRG